MTNSYKVIKDKKNKNTITINKEEANKKGLKELANQKVKFGQEVIEMAIKITDILESKEIMISTDNDFFNLPLSANYELKVENDVLEVGPYIGIMLLKYSKYMKGTIKRATSYVHFYKNINGAVITFSYDKVNIKNKTIQGYLWNPEIKKWELGTFKYPAAMFCDAFISNRQKSHFLKELDNRLYNSRLVNKWIVYQQLSQYEKLKEYLPETIKYSQPSDVDYFIKKYGAVYMKPIYGSLGRGIKKIMKEGNKYTVKYTIKKQKHTKSFASIEQVYDYLKSIKRKRTYVLQQPLDISFDNNNVIDFRICMNKDQAANWVVHAIYGKKGATGNIVSNVSNGAIIRPGKEILKIDYKMTDEEVEKYYEEMCGLVLLVGKAFDDWKIHMGRSGLDVAIDKNKKIWFIEANNIAIMYGACMATGKKTCYKMREANMLYAKRLAGFVNKE